MLSRTVQGAPWVTNDLLTIKRCVLSGHYAFSAKAQIEMEADRLTELDIVESIAGAPAIQKRLRSTSPRRAASREYLYIIQGITLDGMPVYTKGKFIRRAGELIYYFLVSAKRAL